MKQNRLISGIGLGWFLATGGNKSWFVFNESKKIKDKGVYIVSTDY